MSRDFIIYCYRPCPQCISFSLLTLHASKSDSTFDVCALFFFFFCDVNPFLYDIAYDLKGRRRWDELYFSTTVSEPHPRSLLRSSLLTITDASVHRFTLWDVHIRVESQLRESFLSLLSCRRRCHFYSHCTTILSMGILLYNGI